MALALSVLAFGGACGRSTPAAPVPAAHRVWYGVSLNENDPAAYASYLRAVPAPAPTVRSVFLKLDSGTAEARLRAVVAQRQTPFVTLEPWSYHGGSAAQPEYALSQLIAGRHDAALTRLAALIKSVKQPVLLRFAHEMNGTWYPWAIGLNMNTEAEYVAAWRHTYQLFVQEGVRNVKWVWSPNAVDQPGTSSISIAAAYPGDDVVDYVGMTGYARASGETPDQTFDKTLTALTAIAHKPVLLSEIGASGPTRATWLRQLGPWIGRHADVRGFIYFSTSPESTGATGNYEIRGGADGQALASTITQLDDFS